MGIKLFILFSDMWDSYGINTIIYVTLGLNLSTFIWQSIDALLTDFKLWFVTSLNWMSQLASISQFQNTVARFCKLSKIFFYICSDFL